MSKPKSLEVGLLQARGAVKRLPAQREDNLEDYFHDAITKALTKGKTLEDWLGYLYKSVWWRIFSGQEGHQYLPLNEDILQTAKANLDLKLDIQKAFGALAPLQKEYIYKYFYEGLTEEEIALEYQKTQQSVSQVIARGLETMKKVLKG